MTEMGSELISKTQTKVKKHPKITPWPNSFHRLPKGSHDVLRINLCRIIHHELLIVRESQDGILSPTSNKLSGPAK